LQRLVDGLYWNGTTGFTSTPTYVPMPELNQTVQPGLYSINFNQTIDNVPDTYFAYYNNSNPNYLGSAVEEIVYGNIEAEVDTLAIASAVAAKILVNPAIQIDSSDIASQNTLLSVLGDVEYIEQNMALESTLLSGLAVIENDLNTILSIIQPLAGSNTIQFVFTDQNSLPIPGVKVTIKNQTDQITLAVGVTDTNGQVTFGLPTGVFNALFYKSFVQFPTLPYNFTVNANAVIDIDCVTFQPTAPTPTTCACYCYITDATGQPIPNILFRAKLVSNFPYSAGSAMLATKDYVESISDGTGYIQLNLIQGGWYELSAPALFYTVTDWQVPVQTNLDLSTLLNVSS
jgi:hypothetical protein